MSKSGKLILEDGSVYSGLSFGFSASTTGEVVFTTGMVGYPESLTDPSYRGQILVFTYPLIGNYGVPDDHKKDKLQQLSKHFESDQIQVQGLIVADYSFNHHHWDSHHTLATWLVQQKIPALTGIDTRSLTQKLREKGVMLGKIVFDQDPFFEAPFEDPNNRNLVAEVSIKEKKIYPSGPLKVIIVDCGVKNNIIRSFLQRNITVIRVPWDYNYTQEDYDGLFISNGPGDPKQCQITIQNLKMALLLGKPIFGICLGSQLLALAAGADTYKLKYGHRGQNQPCQITGTKKCYITSQNHGYAVDNKTLPEGWDEWFVNVNDGTNEGIRHKTKPFFAVQFHPESAPGPKDVEWIFDDFIALMEKNKIKK